MKSMRWTIPSASSATGAGRSVPKMRSLSNKKQIQEVKTTGEKYHYLEKTYDALCSLALPTLSEKEIEEEAAERYGDGPEVISTQQWKSFVRGAKWAIKQLTKKE